MKKLILPLSTLVVIAFVLVLAMGNPPNALAENPEPTNMDIHVQSRDVLSLVKLVNSTSTPSAGFNTGHVTEKILRLKPETTSYGFKVDFPGSYSTPSPTVYDGQVYVSGGFGSMQFYVVDAKTGNTRWAVDLDDDGPSSCVIDQDIAVFNTESCTIFALDTRTGEHLWSYWMGDPLMSMPTIANDMVFSAYPAYYEGRVPELDGQTYQPSHVIIAFDLHSGDIKWQKWIDGDIMSAPVAKGEKLYFTTFPGTVYEMNQFSGEFLSAQAARATSAPVVMEDGQLYFSHRADKSEDEEVSEAVTAFSMKDGKATKSLNKKNAPYLDRDVQGASVMKEKSAEQDAGNGFGMGAPASSGWAYAEDNIGYSNVSSLQQFQGSRTLVYNGRLYNCMGNELIATNESNGEEEWKIALDGDMHNEGGFMGTPPLTVGGYILIATYTGDVVLYDAESGEEIEKWETKEPIRSQPVVEDGWIYVATDSGKLLAINTENEELTGWPVWGGDAAHSNGM